MSKSVWYLGRAFDGFTFNEMVEMIRAQQVQLASDTASDTATDTASDDEDYGASDTISDTASDTASDSTSYYSDEDEEEIVLQPNTFR
jgi:hypothetical protein